MLFIQSSSEDASTDDVLDWLCFLAGNDVKMVRLNDTRNIKGITIHLNAARQSVRLATENGTLDMDAIDTRWYRRGRLSLDPYPFKKDSRETLALSLEARRYLDNELEYVYDFIETNFKDKCKSLNRPEEDTINKLDMLKLASELGLCIPETLVTNEFDALRDFAEKHPLLITKSLGANAFSCRFETGRQVKIGMGTVLLTKKDIIRQAEIMQGKTFLPACYQQYIAKRVELRVFYLDGTCYPMAIFSQANEKTKVDFRNYDPQRPNRCVPYSLPEPMEGRLRKLMKKAGLISGSIDMILTTGDDYVFLEVNPIGQFQWLDRSCNYGLNKKIAEYLLN